MHIAKNRKRISARYMIVNDYRTKRIRKGIRSILRTVDFSGFLSFSPFVLLFCVGIVGEIMLYKNTRRKEDADAFLQEHGTLTSGVLEARRAKAREIDPL